MENSRLFRLMRCLTPGQLRKFEVFVSSEYFNQNSRVLFLYQYLWEHLSHQKGRGPNKRDAFMVMFGEKRAFEEQKVHDQASQLLRLLERFLALEEFEDNDLAVDRHLLQKLTRLNAPDHYQRILRKRIQSLEDSGIKDGKFFLDRYRLGIMTDQFLSRQKNRAPKGGLKNAMSDLEAFYWATRLEMACEMINRKNIVKSDYDARHYTEIERFFENEGKHLLSLPVIAIYHQVFLSLTRQDSETHYQQLVALLKTHAGKFEPKEAASMYAYAQNFCIKQINSGKPEYLSELFLIYQRLLEEQMLLVEGQLPHEHYKNITTVGLRLREFAWVDQFLEQYREKIPVKDRINAYTFNRAAWHHEQGDLKSAMRLLREVEFTDTWYFLSGKSLLLKVYFQMQDELAFNYLVKSLKAYLRRQKNLSEIHRQGHLNHLRLLKKLFQLREKAKISEPRDIIPRLEKLKDEMAETQPISNSGWLRDQFQIFEESQKASIG